MHELKNEGNEISLVAGESEYVTFGHLGQTLLIQDPRKFKTQPATVVIGYLKDSKPEFFYGLPVLKVNKVPEKGRRDLAKLLEKEGFPMPMVIRAENQSCLIYTKPGDF